MLERTVRLAAALALFVLEYFDDTFELFKGLWVDPFDVRPI